MKNKYYLCSILLPILMNMPQTTDAQTAGENYIVTETMLDANGTNKVKSVQYYDGLGRPNVLAANGINTKGTYLYTMTEYDNMGRESKLWLPAVGASTPDIIDASTMESNSNNTYPSDCGYAFSETTYDALGRPTFKTTPGKLWKGKGIKTEYITNDANSVKKYTLDNSGNPSKNTYYPAASLTGERVTDEDGHTIETYKDILGNVVLERRKDGTSNNDTYYVYDKGLLKTVIPPLYQTTTSNNTKLLYKYEYDGLGRCTQKTLPGNVIVNYWYDKYGRVSFMQDGRMKKVNKYRFYLYDGLNRLAVQGLTDGLINDNSNSYVAKVIYGTAKQSVGNTGYYIEGSFTISNPSIEIVNYYDGYDFLGLTFVQATLNGMNVPTSSSVCTTTLQTGSVLSTSDGRYVCNVMYYDERGRVIDSRQTIPGDIAVTKTTTYSFTDKPLQVTTKMKMGYMTPSVTETYTYDSKSDKLTAYSYGGAKITYDDLGRVKTKNFSGNQICTSYTYDLHGWLTGYKATKANGTRLFQEEIHYADTYGCKCYNGNIGMVRWLSGDNPMGTDVCNGYKYTYDSMNRLTNASFGYSNLNIDNHLSPLDDLGSVSYTYNANSSITSLVRKGKKDNGYGVLDNLTYNYIGNQLNYISDSNYDQHYEGAFEFKSNVVSVPLGAPEYAYDECGAMTYDLNRGITKIDYDLLGNPTRIQFSNGNVTEYVYSADGTRLSVYHKTATPGITVLTGKTHELTSKEILSKDFTYYADNFTYTQDGVLKYNFADGYSDGHSAYYYIRDHQGNNRAVVMHDGTIKQTTHYYPYGGILSQSTNQGFQKFKYNGKEFDRMHGLDWYDFVARQQDPATGLFTSMDPLCEKYYNVSPYVYCAGNPIRYVDPDGREIIITGGLSQQAFDQLQDRVSKTMTLSMDTNGNLSYKINTKENGKEYKLSGCAKELATAIDDKDVKVNIYAEATETTSTGKLMIGGAFMGNKTENGMTNAYQEVNPIVLGLADGNSSGKMIMHEITEAYQGALYSRKHNYGNVGPTNTILGNEVYNHAHNKATSQNCIEQFNYNSIGHLIPNGQQGTSYVEWKANGQVIQTLGMKPINLR